MNLEHEYALDNITQSAQDFAKQNLNRIKQREKEEMRMHATIKRQQFEKKEKKIKEIEIEDREKQMEKLEEERELLRREYEQNEQSLKELNLYAFTHSSFLVNI